eukprot:2130466-Rhodomonas_salina.1
MIPGAAVPGRYPGYHPRPVTPSTVTRVPGYLGTPAGYRTRARASPGPGPLTAAQLEMPVRPLMRAPGPSCQWGGGEWWTREVMESDGECRGMTGDDVGS